MHPRPLHADQPDTGPEVVRALLAEQFPAWSSRPLHAVPSGGTTNAIHRLGDDLTVRLPLVAYGQNSIDVERRWLPLLADRLPVEVPRFVADGRPGAGYPFRWSVHGWIEGRPASAGRADPQRLAVDLAAFLGTLWSLDTRDAPDAVALGLRGAPLASRAEAVESGLRALHDEIDPERARAIWDDALAAPTWDRAPVWFHGDLAPSNVLLRRGRLAAVIDFAGCGAGDPACDLMIAWSLFDAETRPVFRRALEVDDATWRRGRGWALFQPLTYISYYRAAEPGDLPIMWRLLRRVLADPD